MLANSHQYTPTAGIDHKICFSFITVAVITLQCSDYDMPPVIRFFHFEIRTGKRLCSCPRHIALFIRPLEGIIGKICIDLNGQRCILFTSQDNLACRYSKMMIRIEIHVCRRLVPGLYIQINLCRTITGRFISRWPTRPGNAPYRENITMIPQYLTETSLSIVRIKINPVIGHFPTTCILSSNDNTSSPVHPFRLGRRNRFRQIKSGNRLVTTYCRDRSIDLHPAIHRNTWSGNNRKILIRYELYPAIHPISLYACQFKIRNPTDQHIYPGNSS